MRANPADPAVHERLDGAPLSASEPWFEVAVTTDLAGADDEPED